ncbi:MAG TPA: carboxypeptidase-like regulatory domain-containing protein [Bryobacteraceae bacterium]|nr:carboxypeptidase-like regulatory domain-containing protein [Bryobacteraceae bacterium]
MRLSALLAVLLLPLHAQQLAQLSGIVTDPSGATVEGATVQLESQSKGLRLREVTTGRDGRYAFPQISPDRYRINATAKGFTAVTVADIAVLVATPATVDIAFEKVGTVTESVTVSAEGGQVNTVDASLGNAITNATILQLPSYARNVAGLLMLQPGVNQFGNVNGGKSDQANITLDGIDVNEQQTRQAFTSVLRVTLDSVEEFRTTTTNSNSDQGRSSGAQVALITRSGSNELHGAAYWYHRNTITAANGFFNNLSGVKRPKLLINIPGARVGGPIRKNNLFYFLNWEERWNRSEENASRTVPSVELRQGIVQYRNSRNALIPLSPQQVRETDPRRIGPNAAVLQHFNTYPLPNDTTLGDGLNFLGYRFTAPLQASYPTYIAKFDYQAAANHNLFVRGQLQNDRSTSAPSFPGDPPQSVFLTNGKGLALGYNAILTSNLVSTFRYGLTRYSRESTGSQSASAISFAGLSDRSALTTGLTRKMPLHQFSEDMSWNRGRHSLQFGAIARLVSNQSRNFLKSFHAAYTNVNWLRGTGSEIIPTEVPAVNRPAFGNAIMAVLGIVSEVDASYNYTIDGSVLPVGAPVVRDFRNEEYELYVQDSWHPLRNLTITAGLRWSLMPPVHEANGVQVSTNIPLGDWFNLRGQLADEGRSQEEAGRIVFIRADDPKARPLYPYHKKNFAPRLAIAYSPSSGSGWRKFLSGGPGKSAIRAGWGMYYDLIGQPLARSYDLSAFGFATTLSNPAGRLTATTAPRFTGVFDLPASLIQPAPKGGFPVEYPADAFAITNSIDDKLKTPYTMNMNFSIGRDFGRGWFVQGSYVGRMSRRSLIRRDLAMPTNMTDPASGQTYFEAATQMARLVNQRAPITAVPQMPFWESMFGNLRTTVPARTASQVVYTVARLYPNDFMSALADLDEFCDPDCGRLGPNMMMNPQFSSLSGLSSIAGGNYHSMQWTLRKRFSAGLSLDFNYTLSKSQDLASDDEIGGEYDGFLVNSWNPSQLRGVSDYDQRHIWNLFWVYELPFGRGKPIASNVNRVMNHVIGGWQFSGIWTQSTELPVSVGNGSYWTTNWNLTSYGTPIGAVTPTTKTKNAPAVSGVGGPNMWLDPTATLAEWQFTLPGQTGSRNTLRQDGRSNFDFNLSKRFIMPYRENHSIQFRWETFNVFNQVRFGSPDLGRGSTATWGKYRAQANAPRQMQFALRYEF